MQKTLKILIYFIIGFFALMIISFIVLNFMGTRNKKLAPEVQYIEINEKKGNVMLHVGMIKDSVQILVGKPDEVDLSSVGNYTYENWGYKIKNNSVSDLNIDFENGKLKGVRQH